METWRGQTFIIQCISLRGNRFGRLFDTGSAYGKTKGRGSTLNRKRKGGLEGDGVSPGNLHRIYQWCDVSPEWGAPKMSINVASSTFLPIILCWLRGRKAYAHVIFHNSSSNSLVFSPTPSARTPKCTHTSNLTHITSKCNQFILYRRYANLPNSDQSPAYAHAHNSSKILDSMRDNPMARGQTACS